MKKVLALVAFLALSCLCRSDTSDYEPQIGDILFQSLPYSPLVAVIEGATDSPYSHCGIVGKRNGEWVVYEAIGPVRINPLTVWIDQGNDSLFDAYRLNEPYSERAEELILAASQFLGRPYDIQYDFDDEKIYCSELIFKSFDHVFHEPLGSVVTLGELDWKPYEDFIRNIDASLPLDRKMITPKHLSQAKQLSLVYRTIED